MCSLTLPGQARPLESEAAEKHKFLANNIVFFPAAAIAKGFERPNLPEWTISVASPRTWATQWVGPLWLAARRSGLDVTKKQVTDFVRKRGEKQVFQPVQPARGKTVAGERTRRSRWTWLI